MSESQSSSNILENHVSILDETDPRSIINLVSKEVGRHIKRIPLEYFSMSQRDLKMLAKPTPIMNQLRLSFWQEYNRCQADLAPRLDMASVYSGICSPSYFNQGIIKYPKLLIWILTPPTSYTVAMEEALAVGVERLREILDLPITMESGEVDHRTATLILKTVALLDLRVKGAVTQKHELKTVSLNLNAAAKDIGLQLQGASMEELQKKLETLEKKRSTNPNMLEDTKDAEVIEDNTIGQYD